MEMRKLVIVFLLASMFIMPVAGLQKREQVPTISITTPQKGNLYVMGAQIVWLPFDWTLIIGPITIRAEVSGVEHPIVKFYIDGTQKFTRAQLWDRECLERKVKTKKKKDGTLEPEEKKQYYVYVLEANLAFQNGMVIPLLSEVLSYRAGDNDKNKQDCEQRAFRRLVKRLKKCFSHLSIMVLLYGLYPNGPVIELCRKNNNVLATSDAENVMRQHCDLF